MASVVYQQIFNFNGDVGDVRVAAVEVPGDGEKRCPKCERVKPLDRFAIASGKRPFTYCKRCSCAMQVEYRQTYKGWSAQVKKGGRCHFLSKEQFAEIKASPCHYCGDGGVVGIDRLDNSVEYHPINCVPCCFRCNMAKRTMGYIEFLEWVERAAANLRREDN